MLSTVLHRIIDTCCDDIGFTVGEDKEYMNQFDVVIEAQEVLRAKLAPEDKVLVDQLEEAQASLMGHVERKYYLAGLRDGSGLKQLLTGEAVLHVAS